MNTPSPPADTRKAWLLLAAAVIFWGVNWPIMKLGLGYIGPLWFAALRVMVATVALFAFLGASGRLSLPKADETPILFSIGVVQIGAFMGLIHYALLYVEAGRSSVLAYTTPIWILPLAVWFLGERLNKQKLLGVAIGIGGVAVLFNPPALPSGITWGWNGYTLGNALLLVAAILWAGTIVHVRAHGWTRPHLSLLPWQFLLGSIVLAIVAFGVEGVPNVPMGADFIAIMIFNGVLASAFSFWALIYAARILPASATAMGSLGVPVVGIISSVVIIGEKVSPTMMTGAGLIIFGIAVFTFTRNS
ncbi:MAG: DMT family transporter [Rhodospirillaceae bacterium]|nr:DMT family transporter [Rhodospirillaceae bacterium]